MLAPDGAQGSLQPCLEKLDQCDLPKPQPPRPDQFFYLDALPYLAIGMLDQRQMREVAARFSAGGGQGGFQ